MKLTIEQKPLLATLKRLVGIVESRNTIAILSHFAITAGNNTLTIKATDLDIEATATIAATVESHGQTTVSARALTDFIAKVAAGSLINMNLANDRLHIAAGRASFELATLPIDDFPHLASAEFDATFTASAADINNLLGGTIFAASTEETRYYLQGPYLHHIEGKAVAVATDGHKLAKIGSEVEADFPPVIVPRKTAAEVVKSFADGDVTVSVSETKIRFSAPSFTVLSKVIDGTFPAYDRVIPTGNSNTVTVCSADLRAALDRAMSATDDKTRAVKLIIGEDEIEVRARSANSVASDSVSATLSGEPCEIGFNGAYLSEILRQIEGDVAINYADASTPVLFRGDDAALYLLMPMRVV